MTDYILTETSDPLITVLSGDTVTLAEGESYLGELFGVTDGSAPVSVQIDGTFTEPEVRNDHFLQAIHLETTDPLSQGHSVVVGATGVLTFSTFGAIDVTGGTGGSVTNHGTILLAETENTYDFLFAISLNSPGGHVLNTGTIDLRGLDGNYPFGSTAIFAYDNNTVVNEGAIYAWQGIWAGGEGSEVLNTGSIDADIGIYVDGDGSRIVNEGTITTPYSAEFPAFPGVQVFGSESVVRNTGTMTGGGISMVGSDNTAVNHGVIVADYGGILMDTAGFFPDPGSTLRLLNTGLVESTFGGGAICVAGSGVAEVANTGSVLGSPPGAGDVLAVVEISAGEMTLVNTGQIGVTPGEGGIAVLLHGGDAAFRNAGTVQGDVEFGDGADVYDGTGGAVAGIIRLGLGADTATGGAARDVILGGGGGDMLNGAGGRDILAGQAGADTLDGGAGDDLLIGGAGPDVFVFGLSSGDDVIADAGAGDRLDLSALGAWTEAEVLAEATETGEGVLIDLGALGGDGFVLLAGVALGDLGGDWVV